LVVFGSRAFLGRTLLMISNMCVNSKRPNIALIIKVAKKQGL